MGRDSISNRKVEVVKGQHQYQKVVCEYCGNQVMRSRMVGYAKKGQLPSGSSKGKLGKKRRKGKGRTQERRRHGTGGELQVRQDTSREDGLPQGQSLGWTPTCVCFRGGTRWRSWHRSNDGLKKICTVEEVRLFKIGVDAGAFGQEISAPTVPQRRWGQEQQTP